jgi:hypothetical protein
VREWDLLARGVQEAVAAEIQPISCELQCRLCRVGLEGRRQHLRHAGKQSGLIRHIEQIRVGIALVAGARDEQDIADCGPQFL